MSRIFLVDAFAERGALGNPAGVCLLDQPADPAWMQRVAMEMNQAETAFVWSEGGQQRITWFTPAKEVDLCGHATLASAYVLYHAGLASADEPITFHCGMGPLICHREGERIAMDFPAVPPRETEMPEALNGQLGGALWFGTNDMDYIALLGDAQEVRGFEPDFGAIAAAGHRGLLITAPGDETDVISRFFAPAYGIDEDSVTGSAHCCLGPFWSERLGRSELSAFQASARGGYISIRTEGDRCCLSGQAQLVLAGQLHI